MRIVKRYRRVITSKTLKPWTPLFDLTDEEVEDALRGAGL